MRNEVDETNALLVKECEAAERSFEEWNEVDESNALLVKECEATERSFEEAPPSMKETLSLVEDTNKINNLISEVENLKVMLMGYLCLHFSCLFAYKVVR